MANFKKALGEEEKTDLRDAGVVAERLRFGKKLPRPFVMDELYLPLRTLTRYRYHLVRELVRVKSYCLSLIYLKATGYGMGLAPRAVEFARGRGNTLALWRVKDRRCTAGEWFAKCVRPHACYVGAVMASGRGLKLYHRSLAAGSGVAQGAVAL